MPSSPAILIISLARASSPPIVAHSMVRGQQVLRQDMIPMAGSILTPACSQSLFVTHTSSQPVNERSSVVSRANRTSQNTTTIAKDKHIIQEDTHSIYNLSIVYSNNYKSQITYHAVRCGGLLYGTNAMACLAGTLLL